MNDQKPTTAKTSLCFHCKHGICVKETEVEKLYQPQKPVQEPDGDIFGQFKEQSEDEESLIEHTIENDRVKAVCYWRPAGIESPPILMNQVSECNRFEKCDTKNT
jgi:hypothetical protein